jgi:hypothetical protein
MKTMKEAVRQMIADKEDEKILKKLKGGERKRARDFFDSVKALDEEKYNALPELVLIHACQSSYVWSEIYLYLKALDELGTMKATGAKAA